MKKTFIILIIVLFGTAKLNAQSTEPTIEQKQVINPLIDNAFQSWSEEWNYDTYISRSAKILSIEIDQDYGDIKVTGNFTYKRLVNSQNGTFSATLSLSDDSVRILKLSYTDASGVRDTKNF